MPLSRRAFVSTLAVSGATFLTTRRAGASALQGPTAVPAPRPLLLHNNENPLGPGQAALDAVRAALGDGTAAGRYTFRGIEDLHRAIAKRFSISHENVASGCGSTQILRSAVQMYTGPDRPLVAGALTYEECAGYADLIGTPVVAVPLDAQLKLDLDAMAEASKGAGVVFLNNPNNPTATLHGKDAVSRFVDRVRTTSPGTTILIDEAYHDYVTDKSHETQIPAALKDPKVIVARTFSKAHGMAGMRIGYAISHPDTIKTLWSWEGANALNLGAMVAAMTSIGDLARLEAERDRNTAVRKFTTDWFARNGFSSTDSQTNFLFVNVKRPAREFRDACRAEGVIVARDFPPFEKSHVRISIGTMDEMKQAVAVFGKVLGVRAKAA